MYRFIQLQQKVKRKGEEEKFVSKAAEMSLAVNTSNSAGQFKKLVIAAFIRDITGGFFVFQSEEPGHADS